MFLSQDKLSDSVDLTQGFKLLDAKTLRVSLCEDQVLSAFVNGFVLLRSVGCKMMYELPVFTG